MKTLQWHTSDNFRTVSKDAIRCFLWAGIWGSTCRRVSHDRAVLLLKTSKRAGRGAATDNRDTFGGRSLSKLHLNMTHALGCMKLMTWNVNALATTHDAFKSSSVYSRGGLAGFLAKSGIDILCIQEHKMNPPGKDDKDKARRGLFRSVAAIDGYESFWSFSTYRQGFAGVAVWVRSAYSPVAAEDGPVSGFFGSVDLSKTGRSVLLDFGSWCLINVYVPNAGHRVKRGGRRGGGKAVNSSSSSSGGRGVPSSASRGGPSASGVTRPEAAEPAVDEAPIDVVFDGDEGAEGEGLEDDEEAGAATGAAIPGQEHRPTLPIKMAFLIALRRKGERYGSTAHRNAAVCCGYRLQWNA